MYWYLTVGPSVRLKVHCRQVWANPPNGVIGYLELKKVSRCLDNGALVYGIVSDQPGITAGSSWWVACSRTSCHHGDRYDHSRSSLPTGGKPGSWGQVGGVTALVTKLRLASETPGQSTFPVSLSPSSGENEFSHKNKDKYLDPWHTILKNVMLLNYII